MLLNRMKKTWKAREREKERTRSVRLRKCASRSPLLEMAMGCLSPPSPFPRRDSATTATRKTVRTQTNS